MAGFARSVAFPLLRGIAFATVLGGAFAAAQAQATQESLKGIPGFLNPKNGTFTVVPNVSAQPELATATYTGTINMKFTISIVSGGSSVAPITCTGSATTFIGTGPQTNYIESKSVKAIRNGSTATCLVSIPYSWVASGTNQISLSYTVGLSDNTGLTISRSSSSSLAAFVMPPSGSTTTRELQVTL